MVGELPQTIKQLIDRIKNSPFIKSVLTLSAGVVVSQVVALCTTPIISRIYNPEVLGDFSIITSSASIISVIVCLGLMASIMIPKEDDEARRLCRLLILLIVGLSTIFFLAVITLSNVWKIFSVNLDYRLACLILYLNVVLTNISSVCYSYINRQKMYKVLFFNPALGTVTNAIVAITLGLLHCGLKGYAIANIIAIVVVILNMLRNANPFSGKIQGGIQLFHLIKTYKEFILYILPSDLLGTIARQIPIQMLSAFFGNAVLGSFSMCILILGIPSKFLAGPVNRVFYREAIERYNHGENIGEFSYRILKTNIKIALIPIIILIIFGEPLFAFVLGSKWAEAGAFASFLGIYQLVSFCNSCLNGKFIVVGKKRLILALNTASVILYGGTFLLCFIMRLKAIDVIAIFAIVGAIFELTDTTLFMVLTKVKLSKYFNFVLLYLLIPVALANCIRLLII